MSRSAATTHGDAGLAKLLAHRGSGNAQLSTDLAQAPARAYKSVARSTSTATP
jgi:hypothetical protein